MRAPPLTLQVRQASKAYDGVPALSEAGLDLFGGEVHGLVGENGAGKSTLIKLLAGLERPDAMSTRLQGRAVAITDSAAAYRLGLRFIHQELNIVPALSVAENLFINNPLPRWAGAFVDWRALHHAAGDALEQLGIGHINLRGPAARLSTGDAMLVKIASAFIGAPRQKRPLIYVMDEPTAALNNAEVALLFDVIARLRERGHALLYVTHRLHELFQIAQRVTVMRDGRVINSHAIAETSPDELISEMTGREVSAAEKRADACERAGPSGADAAPRQSAPGLLEVRDISTDAIVDADFALAAGEVVGVAGLAGSGRSELLHALFGIDRLTQGSIRLQGETLRGLSPTLAWARGIAFLPEERRSQGLVLGQRISHNISLPHLDRLSFLRAFTRPRQEAARSEELGAVVQLRATGVQQRVRQLSGGNQQKVMFARSILARPRLILLDEPTRGVDVGAKFDIYRLIRQLAADGAGILLVSSEFDELIALCQRILIMREGRVTGAVPAAGLSESRLLSLMFADVPASPGPMAQAAL